MHVTPPIQIAGSSSAKEAINSHIIGTTIKVAKGGAKIPGGTKLRAVSSHEIGRSSLYTHDQALQDFQEALARKAVPHHYKTAAEVTDEDTLDAAVRLQSEGLRPLAIDMATSSTPGGGIVALKKEPAGTVGEKEDWIFLGTFDRHDYFIIPRGHGNVQEEKILYRGNGSLLYMLANWKSLAMTHNWFAIPNNPRGEWDQYFIPPDGAILAPQTQYIGKYTGPKQSIFEYTIPYIVDVAAISAFRHHSRGDRGVAHDSYHWPELKSDPVFQERMHQKIENLFLLGIINGNDSIVAGAIGAGACQVPVGLIIDIYQSLMRKYGGYFKKVTFAIYDPTTQKKNFHAFHAAFSGGKTYSYNPAAQGPTPWFNAAHASAAASGKKGAESDKKKATPAPAAPSQAHASAAASGKKGAESDKKKATPAPAAPSQAHASAAASGKKGAESDKKKATPAPAAPSQAHASAAASGKKGAESDKKKATPAPAAPSQAHASAAASGKKGAESDKKKATPAPAAPSQAHASAAASGKKGAESDKKKATPAPAAPSQAHASAAASGKKGAESDKKKATPAPAAPSQAHASAAASGKKGAESDKKKATPAPAAPSQAHAAQKMRIQLDMEGRMELTIEKMHSALKWAKKHGKNTKDVETFLKKFQSYLHNVRALDKNDRLAQARILETEYNKKFRDQLITWSKSS